MDLRARSTLQPNQISDEILTKLSFWKKEELMSGLILHLILRQLFGGHNFPIVYVKWRMFYRWRKIHSDNRIFTCFKCYKWKNYHVHVFLDLLKLVKQKYHWIIEEKFIFLKIDNNPLRKSRNYLIFNKSSLHLTNLQPHFTESILSALQIRNIWLQ